MGLSSSQGRFLMLTAKKSDVEYKTQQIAHRRMNLTRNMQDIQKAYCDRINNKVLKFKNIGSDAYSVLTYYEFLNNEAFKGNFYLTNENNKKIVASVQDIPEGADESEYFVDEQLADKDNGYFEKCIQEGIYFITQDGIQRSIAELSMFKEVYDDSDDNIAQAEYTSEIKKVEDEDKKMQLELDVMKTEHQAIQTEMEGVKKVIEQNISNSFKTFSG